MRKRPPLSKSSRWYTSISINIWSSPLHILLDGRLILAQQTGISRYLLGFLSGLKEIPCDDELDVWLQRDLPAEHPVWSLGASHIHLHRIPLKHMDWRAQWWAPLRIRQSKPDLYHYPHFDLPWLVLGKILLTLYDLKYLHRPDYFHKNSQFKGLVYRLMLENAVKKARRILTISHYSALDLVDKLGVDLQKIRVVSMGVDNRFHQRCSQAKLDWIRQKYHLAPGYLLFVGERRPHKNLLQLVRAFAMLQKTVKDSQLVIAGKSYADYQAPQALVEQLGLSRYVRFLDYVPEGQLPALYQAAGVFCLLSDYEGFGLPVIEALASGVPVVAAERTALPEVLGEAGTLVDPSDPESVASAISRLLLDKPRRQNQIQLGLARARHFTWEKCARQTLDVYHEVG